MAAADHDRDRDHSDDPHDLHRFLYQPIRKDYTHAPSSKEERLKTIIANIDRRHAAIHAAIIQDAKQQLEQEKQSQSRPEVANARTATETDPSAMDIDDDNNINNINNNHNHHAHPILAPPRKLLPTPPTSTPAQEDSHAAALEALYANLATPWDPRSDPEHLTSLAPPPPSNEIVQATLCPEVRHAVAARERIAAYDEAARASRFGRDYYVLALGRVQQQQQQGQQQQGQEQQAAGEALPLPMMAGDLRRRESGGNGSLLQQQVQQSHHQQQTPQQANMVASPAANASPASNASPRDPRLLCRQNSTSSAAPMDPRLRGR